MSLQFTTSDESSATGGVKMLVYGLPKMGKTMLAATLPAPILLSAESGLLSLSQANQMRVLGKHQNIPVIQIKDVQDLTDAFEFVATSKEAEGFQSVALDSISEIAEVVLNNAKRMVKDPRQAYGELAEKMTTLIRSFRDLPDKHVYFSCQQEKVQDADGMLMFGPSMPGKQLTGKIAYFFDEVFALQVSPKQADGSTYRFLRTKPEAQWMAGDRSGALDDIEEPNLANIIAKIQSQRLVS